MKKKIVVGIVLTLLILSLLTFTFTFHASAPSHSMLRTPRVDELLIKIYPNMTSEFVGLNATEIDLVDSPLTGEWFDAFQADPDIILANYPWMGMFQLDLNNNETLPDGLHNPCSDHEFRHALAHLVNRTYLVNTICEGQTLPMYTPVPPALEEYVNPDVDKHPYSQIEAASMLDVAGYVDTDFDEWRNDPVHGRNVNLTFYYRTDLPFMTEFSEWYGDQLISVDLAVTTIPLVHEQALNYIISSKDFHLYTGGWSWDSRDPEFLYDIYHSSNYQHPGSCSNYVHFNDTEYDHFSSMLKHPSDFIAAKEAAMECQRVLASGARIGVIPLWCSILQKAHRKHYVHWAGEEPYWDRQWVGMVNEAGFGLDSWWTFLNCHPAGVATGGKIRWGFQTDIEALNPVNSSGPWDWLVLDKIYDSLLKYNPYNLAEDIPCMAESYELGIWDNPDTGTNCTKLVFQLKEDMRFHDGVLCRAEDVKFTIDYMKQFPSSHWYPVVADVHHVEAPNPFTVVVYENVTSCWALHKIGELPILPRHIWKDIEDPTGFAPDADLIGTGPFRFHSYVTGESVRLLSNLEYMRPRVYVNPPISYVGVGEAFPIDVSVAHVADLYGFEFRLGYDSTILDAMEVIVHPSLNEPIDVYKKEINEDLGFIWVNVTSRPPAEPVGGSTTLATVFFRVVGFGECVLDLHNITLRDPSGFSIDHSVEDGFYEGGLTQVVSTESNLGSYHPSLAVDSAGNVHVAWHDLTDLGCGSDWDIFYRRREVEGGWTETEVVSTESDGTSAYPSLAVDSAGNVHVAWHDNTTDLEGSGSDWDIFYKRYEVGVGWAPTEVVSTNITGNSLHPSLAVDSGGNVHVAWEDETNYEGSGSDRDIFYKRYEVGVGWTTIEVVSINNKDSYDPSLAVDSAGNVHVAWEDYTGGPSGNDLDIFYRRFDVGVGWSETEVVSTESNEDSYDPSLAVDSGGNVHIAWDDDTDYAGSGIDRDIFYKNRTSSWSTTVVVSTESNATSWVPSLAVDSSRNVHIAWDDRPEVGWTVFYKRHEVAKANWTRTQVVSTESNATSWVPSLAVDSSRNVHIAWHDVTDYAGCGSDADIFYKYLCLHSTTYAWPMFHNNPRHTGYTESPSPNTNKTQWTYTTGNWVESSPAVAYGMVFVGSNDGDVYALDQHTGALVWNYTTGTSTAVYSSPAIAYGNVYVASFDHKVYCLDAATGAHLWNRTTGGWMRSSPAVADGKVYVGSEDAKVYCFDAFTGESIWNQTMGGWMYTSSPAVAYGRVYIGSTDNKTHCLDASTGDFVWSYPTGDWVRSSPAVADGRVYVGSYDNKVYCLNASTGALVWNYTTLGNVHSSPAVADGKVYVGSGDGRVYCLNASTREQIWNQTTGGSGGPVFSSPAVADGKVYVGSGDKKVYCLDASTGDFVWNYTTGNIVYSSPAVADGMVFVGSDDSTVYAFGSIIRVPEDYPTIQEAIDAADTGDTISIAAGPYREALKIQKKKKVKLVGRKGSSTDFIGGGSGIAVTITNSSEITVSNIVITNWDQGVLIDNSSECNVYDNIMYLMGDCGIIIDGEGAVNNQIYDNSIHSNDVAINIVESSTSNTIYNNTISSNSIGLNLESGGNTVYANIITQNTVGINMSNSDSNKIYWNNFINSLQAHIEVASYGNLWDNGYPSGGNYWSDYKDKYPAAEEYDNSGIWNTPYIIDAYNVDNYPLMNPVHEIAITEVIPYKNVVGQGYSIKINVTVANKGRYTETFSFTLYAETTIITEHKDTFLTYGASTTITLTWSTIGVPYGNYTISCGADIVIGEIGETDNMYVDSWVVVTIVGDVDGDGDVDGFDLTRLCGAYGSSRGDPTWDEECDINGDGIIDGFDLTPACGNYGKTV